MHSYISKIPILYHLKESVPTKGAYLQYSDPKREINQVHDLIYEEKNEKMKVFRDKFQNR